MSGFTISKEPNPTLVTLEEALRGQVDIMLGTPNQNPCRIAAIGDGKLHLFKMSPSVAQTFGIQLDGRNEYPIIQLV